MTVPKPHLDWPEIVNRNIPIGFLDRILKAPPELEQRLEVHIPEHTEIWPFHATRHETNWMARDFRERYNMTPDDRPKRVSSTVVTPTNSVRDIVLIDDLYWVYYRPGMYMPSYDEYVCVAFLVYKSDVVKV